MTTRKKILTLLAILFGFAIAHGQNVFVVNFTDNTKVAIPFSSIKKITFNSNNMLLRTNAGENSYSLDHIASITFLDEEVGIKDFTETIDVNIYVNASGEIVAESPHQINQLMVFDLTGRQVATSSHKKMTVNFLPTGIYILQVITDKGLVSKKFIKNN